MTDFTKPVKPADQDDYVLEVHSLRHRITTDFHRPSGPPPQTEDEEKDDGEEHP